MEAMLSQRWSAATLGDGLSMVDQFAEELKAADPSTDEMAAELAVTCSVLFARRSQALDSILDETDGQRAVPTPVRNNPQEPARASPEEDQSVKETQQSFREPVTVEDSQPITPTQHEVTPVKPREAWSEEPDRQPDGPSPVKAPVSPQSMHSQPQSVVGSTEPVPQQSQGSARPEPEAEAQKEVEAHSDVEDATGGDSVLDIASIPKLGDPTAPAPKVGQHTLSRNAIRCRTNRIFKRKSDGTAKVSEAIFQEWHQGGEPRRSLEEIFKQVGYDVETWLH